MLYREYTIPQRVCTGKLFWIWGAYAYAMWWVWNGLTAAGFPTPAVWGVAGLAGAMLLLATREI